MEEEESLQGNLKNPKEPMQIQRPIVGDNPSECSVRNPMSFVNISGADVPQRTQEAYRKLDRLITRWENEDPETLAEQQNESSGLDSRNQIDTQEAPRATFTSSSQRVSNPLMSTKGVTQRYFSTMEDFYNAGP
eukprot:TRINITY_DN14248_c0_g1_i2.p1 TRINITY_DN14248_c0_g1~~TRINITY_DN14248_c0_g1_i2.p1  ORF type:complete len:134 (-),score=17.69 TRINITY_DN14248_c0_g1_i2:44-445(-)